MALTFILSKEREKSQLKKLISISVGIKNVEDLLNDFSTALHHLKETPSRKITTNKSLNNLDELKNLY